MGSAIFFPQFVTKCQRRLAARRRFRTAKVNIMSNCNPLLSVNKQELSTFSTGFSTAVNKKPVDKSGGKSKQQKISTALHKTVEISFVNITAYFLFEQQLCGQDPLVLGLALAVGIHPEGAVLQEVPVHIQILALPGFGKIADGEFLQGVPGVEGAGQQIADPV